MRDHGIWSIGFGRWNGVHVRVHMFLLLFAAFTVYLGWLDSSLDGRQDTHWHAPALVVILVISVIIHEFGHVFVARRLGGHVDEVVLGPFGGLSSIPMPKDALSELVAVAAGPLMNLGICFLTALVLALQANTNLIDLMYPFSPNHVTLGTPLMVVLKMTFWVNWLLILVNLIPAFPFDGGRALKAGILGFLPQMRPRSAVMIVARVAKLTAVGLLIIAWIVRNSYPVETVQTWFALVLLAIFVYFSARKAEHTDEPTVEDAFLGYDFSEGFTSLEKSGPKCSTTARTGMLVGWLENRRRLKEQTKRESDAEEDGRVDEILSQVHESGIASLSPQDRNILDRASQRYRDRSA